MDQYPKISIVTTNYNQDKFLEQTILSVLNQNYPNLEYIVIDAGSTDKSVDIIKKYEGQLSYWESIPDDGMYDGLQKGLARSTGEIMAWINSDDMYLSKSLFTVAEIFSNFKQVNWLLGYPTLFDTEGRIVESQHHLRQWSKFDMFTGNYRWIQQESVFWRRSLWNKVGGSLNTKLKLAGDFDLWLRFFKHDKLYITTAILAGFRMRSEQKSYKEKIKYQEEIDLLLANISLSNEDNKIVNNFFVIKNIAKILSKFKIFNTSSFVTYFRIKKFDYPPVLVYNRDECKFEIK